MGQIKLSSQRYSHQVDITSYAGAFFIYPVFVIGASVLFAPHATGRIQSIGFSPGIRRVER
jgi:hypothetical protein